MKKYKTIGIFVIVALIAIVMIGCGKKENSKFTGKYKCTAVELEGEKISGDTMGDMQLEFNKGGKGSFIIEDESQNITWDAEKGTLNSLVDEFGFDMVVSDADDKYYRVKVVASEKGLVMLGLRLRVQ